MLDGIYGCVLGIGLGSYVIWFLFVESIQIGLKLIGLGNVDYLETFLRDSYESWCVEVGSILWGNSKHIGRIDLIICIEGASSGQVGSIFFWVFWSKMVEMIL
jgi:hypothetical protein